MIDVDLTELGQAAGRLVAYGLDTRARPSRIPEYAELVSRLRSDGAFRVLTEATLTGLGLSLLYVGERGVVLGCREDSAFALKTSDYRQNMSVDERLCHGLIQLAIASWAFPTAASLGDSETATLSVSTHQIVGYLVKLCEELAQEETADPEAASPELREAWRGILERAETRDTSDGRRSPSTLVGMVGYALDTLASGGLLRKTGEEQGGTWQTLTAYRIQIRELAATESFELIRRLGRRSNDPQAEV